jgi:hypothetical protein
MTKTMTRLVKEWRNQGESWLKSDDRDENTAGAGIQVCADELEALIKQWNEKLRMSPFKRIVRVVLG